MKREFTKYLAKNFNDNQLEIEYTIGAKFNLRFELGKDHKNGTIERVNQATKRASFLFEDFFKDTKKLYILVYDYSNDIHATDPNYLYDLLENAENKYQSGKVLLNKGGKWNEEGSEGRIGIFKIATNGLEHQKILRAISNCEMGFTPKIHQRVYFFDTESTKVFFKYDDRGCLTMSQQLNDLRKLYKTKNSWIVDYHRAKIDKQFK